MRRTNPDKSYTVEWRDPESNASWQSADDIKEWAKSAYHSHCTSHGYITHRTKDYLVISGSRNSQGEYGDSTIIPLDLVVSIKPNK